MKLLFELFFVWSSGTNLKYYSDFYARELESGASSRWSFGPDSALGSIEMTTIRKTHHTLFEIKKKSIVDYPGMKVPNFFSFLWMASDGIISTAPTGSIWAILHNFIQKASGHR